MKKGIVKRCFLLTMIITLLLLAVLGCQSATSVTTSGTTLTTTAAAAKYPDYLNLDGYYPIVKDGNKIILSVGVSKMDNPSAANPENLWLFKYLTQKMNIQFKFTTIPASNWEQQKTLLFASDDIFDVSYGLALSTTDIMLYGKEEGQILPINKYITKDLAPAMYQYFQEKPNALALATAADGNVYFIPRIQVDTYTTSTAPFINEVALKDSGFTVPTTLDGFVKLMQDWKAKYPDSTPISGGYSSGGPMKLILSALGVVTQSNAGSGASLEFSPSLYKGKAIIPVAEKEIYAKYISILKNLYTNRLVSQDFFTMDSNKSKALVASGDSIVLMGVPSVTGAEKTFDDWEAMVPLTSDLNTTPQWDAFNPVAIGQVWFGAKCKYPEVAMRWFDWYYTDQGCVYMWLGPMQGQSETLGVVPGWYMNDKNAISTKALDDKKYNELLGYYIGEVSPGIVAGNYSSIYRARLVMAGREWKSDIASLTASTGDNNAQISMYNNMKKYVINGYPAITYVDSKTAARISELSTLIGNYAKNQSARFITGERPLTEIDQFITELNNMGMSEYKKIYEDIYKTYTEALK